jgi:hypothetical protein
MIEKAIMINPYYSEAYNNLGEFFMTWLFFFCWLR